MTGQTSFLQSLGWAILNSLWQLALLWVVYQLITAIFRQTKAWFRTVLASGLLISGFGWFVVTFLSSYFRNNPESVNSSVFVNPAASETVNNWLEQTLPIASVVYLILLIFPFLQFVRNYRYVQVIRKFGLSKINVEWKMFVAKISAQMNIKKTVKIWISEFVSSPVTIGFIKPVILVPLAAINHLSTQQLEAVLLHELSHIRRYDYLVNLIINIIQAILYFNPFVKGFVKIIEREREKSCDEMVLQYQYNAHEYASALLTLEQAHRQTKPLALAAAGKKNDLLHRVELIMGVRKEPVFSFQKMAGLMAGLLCVIALQAILLFMNAPRSKQLARFQALASSIARVEPERTTDIKETPKATIAERPAIVSNQVSQKTTASSSPIFASAMNPDFMQAGFEITEVPVLKKYQEVQVEQALRASKKVLESVQWKVVEKSIADVFNSKEKEVLKASYHKQIQKMDWDKWEKKLKLAYNNVDWEKINAQLNVAVNQVRMDSIQHVYNIAIAKMDDVSKELSQKEMKGIPDTDITLKELDQKRTEVRKALSDLKAVRTKKIVHL